MQLQLAIIFNDPALGGIVHPPPESVDLVSEYRRIADKASGSGLDAERLPFELMKEQAERFDAQVDEYKEKLDEVDRSVYEGLRVRSRRFRAASDDAYLVRWINRLFIAVGVVFASTGFVLWWLLHQRFQDALIRIDVELKGCELAKF